LALDLALGHAPAKEGEAATSLRVDLKLAGNQAAIDGRIDSVGSGAADRWQIDVDASALVALAPFACFSPVLAAWAPYAGSARGSVSAHGRWPRLRTEGTLTMKNLDVGSIGVADGSMRWRIDLAGADVPLTLQVEAVGLRWDAERVDRL